MSLKKCLVIGIGGVTNGGKTSLCKYLNKYFPSAKILNMDDYYYEEDSKHHIWVKELNHQDWDVVSSVDMTRLHGDIEEWVRKANEASSHKESIINNNINIPMLIVEGIVIYNYKPLLPLYDKKYYLTLERDTCYERRKGRHYEPPDKDGYFDLVVWPRYLQYKEETGKIQNIDYIDGTICTDSVGEKMAAEIQELMTQRASNDKMTST